MEKEKGKEKGQEKGKEKEGRVLHNNMQQLFNFSSLTHIVMDWV